MPSRLDKFREKISGEVRKKLYDLQKDSMVANETQPTKDLVEIELEVKGICQGQPIIHIPYYIIFGKEIYKILNKHTEETAGKEICIRYDKWKARGLEEETLNNIVALYSQVICEVPEVPPEFVAGMIVMWNGLLVNIPAGWEICDGTNGKPDLRHKFVRGAGAAQDPGDTGGSETHTHLVSGNSASTAISHRHTVNIESEESDDFSICCYGPTDHFYHMCCYHTHTVIGSTGFCDPSHAHSISFTSAACSTLPTYYEVIFIIKV